MITPRYKNYYTIQGTGINFNLNISKCSRAVGTYQEELINNAIFLKENTKKDIYVFYSGGLDSEYIIKIFLSQKIKITPIIVSLEPNYNSFDISYAIDFCKYNDLKPIIINFDFDNFVTSGEFLEVARSANCIVYQYPVFLKLSKTLDGTIIFGSDQPHLCKDDNSDTWYFDERERIVSVWYNWYKNQNLDGTPSFLNYNPETLLSFLYEPRIKDLVSNKIKGRKGTSSSKLMIYDRHFKDMRSRSKYDGFEIIRTSKIFSHPDIQMIRTDPMDYSIPHNGYFKISYNSLLKKLTQ